MHDAGAAGVSGDLTHFRQEFHRSLSKRPDALFELVDAVLCADGPVRSLPELSLVGEHRRGHGGLYAGLARGRLDADRLRGALVAGPLPRAADGRLVLAVDITCWLRPEAHTSPQRILCHTYGRGKDTHIMVPGWPYSVVVALETGRSSWTAPLDAVRLAPGDDAATVTAQQVRQVVSRLLEANHWRPGDPEILLVADAGYDGPRLAFLLHDLPVIVLVRMRSDRVLRRPAPAHLPGTRGRPRRHGDEFVFGDPATWGQPDVTTRTDTRLYGPALARAWNRLHPRLTRRTTWATHIEKLPIIEGTVIRLEVGRLPSGAVPKPVWLWHSGIDLNPVMVDLLWQAFLRRFDIEHTFRMLKQTLGWTSPKLRTPEQGDRWTWLILAAYTQLRLARGLAADLRRPWEKTTRPDRLTPARVRRGFRHIRTTIGSPTTAPKPTRPGPGRPAGRPNQRPAPRHDVHTVTSPDTHQPRKRKTTKSTTPRPRRTG
ncbi:NF041680 family putative transposase [Actinophytocola xanthii]|uniref:NF041680 family putative transposase n=1 Tax=Actinophytocola xanthii TaxID=1912961 RepID=UPI001E4DE481|nr:NF041680 family putative transposase [Actinophytocola xanthii]